MDSQTWPERKARSSLRRPPGGRGAAAGPGHQRQDADQGEDADAGDGPEGGAPAGRLAEHGAERHAEDVGGGESGEHDGDGAGLLGGGHHVRGHHGADAEERTVGQGGNDPADHHHGVVGGEGRDQVAGDEQHQQDGEHGLALEARHGRGEQQGADDDGEGVAGDQPAGRGLADAEVGGNLGQQAHDHELGESDPEPAEGEGYQANRHGEAPSKTVRNGVGRVS